MGDKIPVIVTNSGVRLWVDPALVKVPDRRRNSRYLDECFAREYLVDLQAGPAAARCGITRNPDAAGRALMNRRYVKERIEYEMQSRAVRLQIDADFVLSELMRQYVRLIGMLGHDMASLYNETGALLPLADWPEVWRTRLVTEVDTREILIGAGDDAEPAILTKIKRESTLSIERELRACLEQIGKHTAVKAFDVDRNPPPRPVQINIVHVAGEIPAKTAEKLDTVRVIDI